MDEDIGCNEIPISSFKSNNIQGRERFIQPVGMMSPGGQMALNAPLSPSAAYCMRDGNFREAAGNAYLAAVAGGGIAD